MAVNTIFFICIRSKLFLQYLVKIPVSRIRNLYFSTEVKHHLITAEPLFVFSKNFPEPSLVTVPGNGVTEILANNYAKAGLARRISIDNHAGQKNPLASFEQTVNLFPFSDDLAFLKRLTFIFRRSPLTFCGLSRGARQEPYVRFSFSSARENRVCFFSFACSAGMCVSSISLRIFIVLKTEREFNQSEPQKSSRTRGK